MAQCVMFLNGEGKELLFVALTIKMRARTLPTPHPSQPPEAFSNITSFVYPAMFTPKVFCEY